MIDRSMVRESVRRLVVHFCGHRDYERLAVVGNARTGSNFLFMGLCSSAHIKMHHEIFAIRHRRATESSYNQIMARLYQKQSRKIRCVGCKLFYEHLSEEEWQDVFARQAFKIIHLTRANRLRTIVSLDIAFMTDEWGVSNHEQSRRLTERRITLDTATLIERLAMIRDWENRIREGFADRPVLEITYQELTENPGATLQRVGDYIGVNDMDPAAIHSIRQNPESLGRLITNYDEVCHVLAGSEFAAYLSDETEPKP